MNWLSKKMFAVLLLVFALLATALQGIISGSHIKRAPQNNNIEIVGSGTLVSQPRPLTNFDKIEAGLTFDISIQQGERFSVVFIADDNWVDYLDAEVNGTTLNLGLKDGYAYNFYNVTMHADVIMPELAGINLTSAGMATIEGFQDVDSLTATLSGASHLDGQIEAKKLDLEVNGNGSVKLIGSSEYLHLKGCGTSLTDLAEFEVKDAELDMACAGRAILQVERRLDGEAAQNSQVFYVSRPASMGIRTHQFAYLGQK